MSNNRACFISPSHFRELPNLLCRSLLYQFALKQLPLSPLFLRLHTIHCLNTGKFPSSRRSWKPVSRTGSFSRWYSWVLSDHPDQENSSIFVPFGDNIASSPLVGPSCHFWTSQTQVRYQSLCPLNIREHKALSLNSSLEAPPSSQDMEKYPLSSSLGKHTNNSILQRNSLDLYVLLPPRYQPV